MTSTRAQGHVFIPAHKVCLCVSDPPPPQKRPESENFIDCGGNYLTAFGKKKIFLSNVSHVCSNFLSDLSVYQMLLQCQAFSVKEVLVNEPVTLLCNCSGNCPSVQWTRFIPSKAVIAESRACRGDSHSEKRFAISRSGEGNSSLMISSVAYTDAGSYMCSCNGKPVTEVKLKVLGKCACRK